MEAPGNARLRMTKLISLAQVVGRSFTKIEHLISGKRFLVPLPFCATILLETNGKILHFVVMHILL